MSIWDKIATLQPTRDSSVANSGGDSWDADVNCGDGSHWKAPPLMRPCEEHRIDYRGRRFGSLTVVGLKTMDASAGKWARRVWVCRCVCGDYETRREKKLHGGGNPDDSCLICAYTRAMLARDMSCKGSSEKRRKAEREALDKLSGSKAA